MNPAANTDSRGQIFSIYDAASNSISTMVPNVGALLPQMETAFLDLNNFPQRRKSCSFCVNSFSTAGALFDYPVRLPCGDIFCYGCTQSWLEVYNGCPQCGCHFDDVSTVQEDVDTQIQRCRQHLETEKQLSLLVGNTAALNLENEARENVLAALVFLDVKPSQATNVNLDDLEAALALLDLSAGDTKAELVEVLRSL